MREHHQGTAVRRRRDERALRESESRFRNAFEAAGTGAALIELDGRLRAVNRSMCEMLGYSEAELLMGTFQQLSQLGHPDDQSLHEEPCRRLLAGEIESFQLQKRYLHRDGHVIWAALTVSLVRNAQGEPSHYISHATDITARVAADQALARRAAELERSNAELEEFAYVASHDLQQPLRAVGSYSQLLAERYHGQLDARADRWLEFITDGVARMQRLTNDLLTLARVRTDGGAFTPTDTNLVVQQSWESVRELRRDDDELRILTTLPVVDADAAQLGQLFLNLFGNACKYRRPDSALHLEVWATAPDPEGMAWELAVRDDGIGLDMRNAEQIFEIFRRLHRDPQSDGTGIGLAICRRIVERHGGRIRVESSSGEGATFFFTLPVHH
jgi:PAS domain S-box-containing protein